MEVIFWTFLSIFPDIHRIITEKRGEFMQDEGWNFEHTFTKLPKIFYRNQKPTPAPVPQMCIFNNQLADSLGLD